MTQFDRLFKNYTDLLARVDAHIERVNRTWGEHIACRKGCDSCCRPLSLFPVEAFALSRAFDRLEDRIKEQARKNSRDQDACPLLMDKTCLVYGARPVICRTHGFPIYMEKEGEAMVDFCPENFKGITELPREIMLNIDQLNTLLTAAILVMAGFACHVAAEDIPPLQPEPNGQPVDAAKNLPRYHIRFVRPG